MSTTVLNVSDSRGLEDPTVALLVHDLRNELTVILNGIESLASVIASGTFDEHIAELQRAGARALQLAREFLTVPRPSPAARRPVDLNQVVAPAAATMSRLMGGGIELQLQLSGKPVPVMAERLDLDRILMNLLLNAHVATGSDGSILIDTAAVGDCARLTVTDTGCGVTPEVQRRMFEPFFTTRALGTGLGLSSVASIVRTLEGTIAVDSEPGRGTSISISLPLAPAAS